MPPLYDLCSGRMAPPKKKRCLRRPNGNSPGRLQSTFSVNNLDSELVAVMCNTLTHQPTSWHEQNSNTYLQVSAAAAGACVLGLCGRSAGSAACPHPNLPPHRRPWSHQNKCPCTAGLFHRSNSAPARHCGRSLMMI